MFRAFLQIGLSALQNGGFALLILKKNIFERQLFSLLLYFDNTKLKCLTDSDMCISCYMKVF